MYEITKKKKPKKHTNNALNKSKNTVDQISKCVKNDCQANTAIVIHYSFANYVPRLRTWHCGGVVSFLCCQTTSPKTYEPAEE